MNVFFSRPGGTTHTASGRVNEEKRERLAWFSFDGRGTKLIPR